MSSLIKCPKCGYEFEISEAIKKDLENKILSSVSHKHESEIKELQDRQSQILLRKEKEIEESKIIIGIK